MKNLNILKFYVVYPVGRRYVTVSGGNRFTGVDLEGAMIIWRRVPTGTRERSNLRYQFGVLLKVNKNENSYVIVTAYSIFVETRIV